MAHLWALLPRWFWRREEGPNLTSLLQPVPSLSSQRWPTLRPRGWRSTLCCRDTSGFGDWCVLTISTLATSQQCVEPGSYPLMSDMPGHDSGLCTSMPSRSPIHLLTLWLIPSDSLKPGMLDVTSRNMPFRQAGPLQRDLCDFFDFESNFRSCTKEDLICCKLPPQDPQVIQFSRKASLIMQSCRGGHVLDVRCCGTPPAYVHMCVSVTTHSVYMRDTARCIYAYLGFRVEGFPEPLTAPAVRSGFTRGVQTATKFQFFTKATSNT